MDRQTGRQTDRHTDIQIDRQTDRRIGVTLWTPLLAINIYRLSQFVCVCLFVFVSVSVFLSLFLYVSLLTRPSGFVLFSHG